MSKYQEIKFGSWAIDTLNPYAAFHYLTNCKIIFCFVVCSGGFSPINFLTFAVRCLRDIFKWNNEDSKALKGNMNTRGCIFLIFN